VEENLAKYQKLVDHVDIFNGLRPADVHKIFQKGMTVRVGKGETVFYKDTQGNQMYVILGGKMGVFDGPKMLAELTVGMTFGEMSLLNGEPRSATIVALEAANLLVLSEEVFQKLLTKRVAVQILLNMSRTMGKRLVASNLKMREQDGR
jgi:CRP-like cAMP-binding protein